MLLMGNQKAEADNVLNTRMVSAPCRGQEGLL